MSQERKQSELLTQFYKAYLWWLEAGAKEDMGFARTYGLCRALRIWANRNAQVEYHALQEEMVQQFMQHSTSFLHPFHTSAEEFNLEAFRGESHLNRDRIQWVKDHAAI
jgi:hypothetical protein